MAAPSPFDLLPDEVVTSVLAFVGARDESLVEHRGHYAKHLLKSHLVCKRFARLVHQVKTLDWPLNSPESALGFMAFVHHESFSIETLNLFVTEAGAEELPHEYIFAAPLLKRLPESVNIHIILPDDRAPLPEGADERGPYITLSEPEGGMLEGLLLKSRVRKLNLWCPAPGSSLGIEKLRAAPVSLLQELKQLRVAVDDCEFAYLELRALCRGLPTLQQVEFYLRGDLDRKGTLSLLRSDFEHVPKLDVHFLETPTYPGTIFQ
ncbi:hypothetical protein KFL_000330340 [Klebsormidium nitens]|uniref:F-box domain-containing protein n=1 Tax=Klebsormidium nitens TaxID=105231 RepID=A0A1Y1HSR2_KLENI|nr:hypothetical protein KFL_000330340 [Klebsormidium nitens]|eukprot:GAQ79587.1 hypothetical protein KFL_000330340 [Klebsormidium nitens]